jgi:hypothetical protein
MSISTGTTLSHESTRLDKLQRCAIFRPLLLFLPSLLQEQQQQINTAIMPTSIPPAAVPKITFLTLPQEIRFAIYEYLLSGSLAIRRPVLKALPHVQNIQPDYHIAILHTCRQIREEAIPILYRSVFIGSCERLHASGSPVLSAMCNASVRVAFCDVPDTPLLFRTWLDFRNPFPNLKHCKLFTKKKLPFLNPSSEGKVSVLGQRLQSFQRGFFDPPRPLIEMKLDLTVYLSWRVIPTGNPPAGCLGRTAMPPELHYEVSNPSKTP